MQGWKFHSWLNSFFTQHSSYILFTATWSYLSGLTVYLPPTAFGHSELFPLFYWTEIIHTGTFHPHHFGITSFQSSHVLCCSTPTSWVALVAQLVERSYLERRGECRGFESHPGQLLLFKERAVLGVVDLFALPRLSTSLPSCWHIYVHIYTVASIDEDLDIVL